MDPVRAQASLDEVRMREQQVADVVARDGMPWWYLGGIAAAFLAVAVSSDLDDIWDDGWIGAVLDYGVPVVGIAVIGMLMVALYRVMGVRPRSLPTGAAGGGLWVMVAFLVVYIGLGTALRAADVSWDSTISGVAGVAVFLGGSALVRRAVRRSQAG